MHYYQFNIGDYASHTSRLSLTEDLAYRRLLDLYYLTERPLNGCSAGVARDIGMSNEQDSVDYVLDKFFHKDGESWINNRVEREIKNYTRKLQSASIAGIASGKARRQKASEQPLNDRSTKNEQTLNQPITKKHKPITKKHKPITKKQLNTRRFTPPSIQEVTDYCRERCNFIDPNAFIDHYQANGWMRGKNKIKDWKACIRTWEKNHAQGNGSNRQYKTKSERASEAADRAFGIDPTESDFLEGDFDEVS